MNKEGTAVSSLFVLPLTNARIVVPSEQKELEALPIAKFEQTLLYIPLKDYLSS